ncbi:leucyl/phenylalanyl-tRNA--protein transferase [Taibaiella soli]|uniref:Leucyl/phenylalanyl-tRNA--protein transferase n=1 Tax=Taibaiella soli TaxID=1649169 RepID=A0A2W2BIA9_9BACT|nr:leucyl/phenylalanyl-tRNA--protein transferase [Taibaiella soli]PZF73246.1 leucyl/phenylalanyl-tRNA--protein transferase [Taibaiella soli]
MINVLNDELWFPPASEAMDDGLLAIGGDLSTERILLAYHNGIFPWFNEDEPPIWWCPDPRFVLFPEKLKISKSMRQLLKRSHFEFKTDTAFEEVIRNCRHITRKDQDGTWIGDEVVTAYTELHRMGIVHSAEAWHNGVLVGGLYGLKIGKVFFGESMFSKMSNASKYAFISYVELLKAEGIALIDCQVHTEHLESLGAEMIPRVDFLDMLGTLLPPQKTG